MVWIGKKIMCPFCLQYLYEKDLVFSCKLCGNRDMVKACGNPLNPQLRCKRPGCKNQIANLVTCGKCNKPLPPDIMSYHRYMRFAMLGTQGSGKSNFLTVMINEFMETPMSFPLSIRAIGDFTLESFKAHYSTVYKNRMPLPPTTKAEPEPMQWCIVKDSSANGKEKKNNLTCSLTIFDGAGENSMHPNDSVCRYLSGAKSLFILFDPLAFENIAKTLPPEVVGWSTTAEILHNDPAFMVDSVASYIRDSCGFPASKRIDCDVAVVMTKIDMIRDSFRGMTLMAPSPHVARGGFVKNDADAVDSEIRDWLSRNKEYAFFKALENNFMPSKIRFFGVSSFGNPPTGEQRLGIVMPHRVLDPLMWLLYKEDVIPLI